MADEETTTTKANGQNDNGGSGDQPGPVPYERFKEVNEQLKTLQGQFAKLQTSQQKAEALRLARQEEWKTLAERREAELEKLQQQVETERLEKLRLKVAVESSLPPSLAARLQGSNEEELKADAAQLAELVKSPAGPGVPPRGGGQKPAAVTAEQLKDPEWVRKNRDRILKQLR